MSLLSYTTGNRRHPIHSHIWSAQDGQSIRDFRASLDTASKRSFSETQGELLGHRYVEDILGYETIFHADDKSIRQGFDSVYFDPQRQEVVVVEFKGQNSPESNLQTHSAWTIDTCQKIENCQVPYSQVSEYEKNAAQALINQYERGEIIRYEVVRTEVHPKTGIFRSQLEKQTRLEKGLEQQYPVQSLMQQQAQWNLAPQQIGHDLM